MHTGPLHWANAAVFYHIYPLGFCGAPARNDFQSGPAARLEKITAWIPHLHALGVNAVYLGPLFESSAHGYDTADYYHVDRRLGDNATLGRVCAALHQAGMHVILDGVFNHVGRDFWAFRDVQQKGSASPYCGWFRGLDFSRRSPYGDPFAYQGWSGNYDLVKLELGNPDLRRHLFDAVGTWVRDFGIDGLRLDVADCLDPDFMQALRTFTRALRPDFWLMGEVVHGDYRRWANPEMLDSVTNYEAYKGLYSSLVDRNYFEIAYALNRQFGPDGLYRGLPLYDFADNHDVDRVASRLKDPAHLYPLYCLLFGMPGVPSIYYGSEWGLTGRRLPGDDSSLRPCLDLETAAAAAPQPDLPRAIARLAAARRASPALQRGDYTQLHVSAEQLAFLRRTEGEAVVVAVNAAAGPARLALSVPVRAGRAVDLLNPGESFPLRDGKLVVDPLPSCWGRVLRLDGAPAAR
jgi:cyclomaltodextrinase / maltogenic alpha-amylase / neopullulanase